MGATCSRSSPPPTETLLVMIPEYSKLLRVPGRTIQDFIFFRGLKWDVEVKAIPKEEGDAVAADYLQLEVNSRNRESALGMVMSIEILDDTGQHTVFHTETSRGSCEEKHGYLMLRVHRNELEASSCVCRDDDSLTARYTLKEQHPKKSNRRRHLLLGTWPSSKSKTRQLLPAADPLPAAASHALTVRSLSELKAALLRNQWTFSTRFAVGGGTWFLALNPTRAAVHLALATKDDDETRITAEFSFALQGAVNVQSHKMRHTFDRAIPYYKFEYQPPEEPSTPSTDDDSLVVRCCLAVIPAAAVDPIAVPPRIESLLTPLLNNG
uniref:Uncharacterized protein n=1 Tax=Avena sativa TaxID=4498 RepID=A0ACD5UIX5_AVESA